MRVCLAVPQNLNISLYIIKRISTVCIRTVYGFSVKHQPVQKSQHWFGGSKKFGSRSFLFVVCFAVVFHMYMSQQRQHSWMVPTSDNSDNDAPGAPTTTVSRMCNNDNNNNFLKHSQNKIQNKRTNERTALINRSRSEKLSSFAVGWCWLALALAGVGVGWRASKSAWWCCLLFAYVFAGRSFVRSFVVSLFVRTWC